jgi:hypothetical protein
MSIKRFERDILLDSTAVMKIFPNFPMFFGKKKVSFSDNDSHVQVINFEYVLSRSFGMTYWEE